MKKRIIQYVDVDIDRSELMTIQEAADYLCISQPAVTQRVQKGLMTMYVDEDAPKHQGRTLVLRSEVDEWKRSREQD